MNTKLKCSSRFLLKLNAVLIILIMFATTLMAQPGPGCNEGECWDAETETCVACVPITDHIPVLILLTSAFVLILFKYIPLKKTFLN